MHRSEWDPPDSAHPVRAVPVWRWILTGAIAASLTAAAALVPIPIIYAYTPGPVRDVELLIEVAGAQTYSSEGALYLTTVSVDTDVTFFEWVGTAFDPARSIVARDQVTGGRSLDELRRSQEQEMRDSKRAAEAVALMAVGLGRPEADAVRIVEPLPNTPADGVLEPGDRILAVDGERVVSTCDVGRLVGAREPGEDIRVTLRRAGNRRTMTITATRSPENPQRAFLGFLMRDVNYRFDTTIRTEVDTGEIAGPSAGLVFALAVYDRLTPDDLTAGRSIAGTGTIRCDGSVGAIGGIEQKVAGAEKKGAEIFLAPAGNGAAARRVARDIEVIEVSTFLEALEYLQGLN